MGERASVSLHHAQFASDFECAVLLDIARTRILKAQEYFTRAHQLTDWSEPNVKWSLATMNAFDAERARENAPRVIHPGKGAHWAAKRAAQAA